MGGVIMNGGKSLKLGLVSNSGFLLEGLRRILQDQSDIEIIFEATGLDVAVERIRNTVADILFIDNRIVGNDNQRLLGRVNRISPLTKIIMFDVKDGQESDSLNVIHINKETDSFELIHILKAAFLNQVVPENKTGGMGKEKVLLSKGEIKVLELVANGLSNKEIARKLSIREKTVKAHLTSIFDKLELRSRYQLIAYRRRPGNHKFVRKSSSPY
jgi:DNA-binding NarL/FixJ family response regulator